MIVGCYDLHLYCDANGCPLTKELKMPRQYTGPTLGYCLRDARKDGWRVNVRKDKAICPKCSGKRQKSSPVLHGGLAEFTAHVEKTSKDTR